MQERREKVVDCGNAVIFLVVCDDEYLLELRPDNEKGFSNEVIIPGGKCQPDEGYAEALLREVEEETGLTDVKPIPLGDAFRAITPSAYLYHMRAYLISIKDKSLVTNKNVEAGRHIWLNFNEAKLINWAHSQLTLERAEKFLIEEELRKG